MAADTMSEKPSYDELATKIAWLEQQVLLGQQLEHKVREQETALRESEEKFRLLFERTPLSYQSLDAEGLFLEVNQAWLETLGYTRDEVIGRSFADFLHPDWVAHFRENFPRFKDIGEILGVEFEMLKKDGSTILVSFNGKIGKDRQGNFLQTHCIFNNISERRQAEVMLAESEERYRAIFEQAAVGIVNTDLDGLYLRVNQMFAEFVGYSEEELLRMNFKSITHPDDLPADLAVMDGRTAGSHKLVSRDKRYIRKDGSIVWGNLSTTLMVDKSGNPTMFLGIVQNIHARKMAEEALRESEHRHRIIFENSPLGMIRFDPEGTIIDCNEKFVELMGSTREKLIGFNGARHSNPKMQDAIKKALAGAVSVYEDFYTSVTGGKTIFLREIFNPVTPECVPSAVIATLEDCTQRHLAEEVIERRILSLTQPLEDASEILFDDLFNINDIQRLQDEFAKATGVASIITRTDGTPITKPSNFTRLCRDVIRTTEKGLANCHQSDAALGRLSTEGPLVQVCMSGGLWDAGAGISVGGHHIANWLIGQVRDVHQSEEKIRRYAHEIGADEEDVVRAFREVPTMTKEHFEEIAMALFTLANRLSSTAYQNVQQARFITDIKQAQEKLKESENRLRFAIEGANDGLWDANPATGETYFSPRSYEILGYSPADTADVVIDWKSLVHPDDFDLTRDCLVAHFKKQHPVLRVEHRLRMKNGEWKWILSRGKVVEWDENGRALRLTGTLTDITERKLIEKTQMFLLECGLPTADEDFFLALARYLAELLEMDYVCIDRLEGNRLSARTVAIYHDGRFEDNVTYTLQDTPCGDVVGKSICCFATDVRHLFPRDAILQEMMAESYAGTTLWDSQGRPIGLIAVIGRRPLTNPHLAESILKLVAIRAAGELERRDTEAEKANLQTQLMQAQKMESVGRLAGGVAHDFNNMLGVILGHVEMAEEQVSVIDPLFEDLKEIKKAAQRSADLTRQLLAFARKQTVSPKVLDLNETVAGLFKMLRRLIGEDIDLAWLPGQGLWQVKIDPTQVDQILANLVVNARDAIDGVGKITIETDNATLDEEYCLDHMGFVPGDYVMLSISDNGCGMAQEVREHLFEPFFTTKEVGQGTGLGLATIYGIVKQNGGFIYVYSEPEEGTTFKIYLPRHIGKAGAVGRGVMTEALPQGRETILLVEDEPANLQLGKRMLEHMGYRVLAAGTPGAALRLAEEHAGEIHLLLTDVVMPEMNGRDLARRLISLYPDIKRLFMSGYTANVIAHHGVLDEGVHFIQKPFSRAELSQKVREALDRTM
jgi:PAS domain S-box-containing protein